MEDGKMHPDMQILIDARTPKKGSMLLEEEREQWRVYAAKLAKPAPSELDISDMDLPVGDRTVRVRIYRPHNVAAPMPAIIYMHGGGFRLGDLDSSDSIAWGLAVEARSAVISVDYRLAPEHIWPAAFDDCYGVMQWVHAHAASLSIDRDCVALAGDSAGGRLTAGLALRARDEGSLRLVAQAMIYASAGAITNSGSMIEFGDGYGLTAERYRSFYAALFPDDRFSEDPYAWPIRAPDLSGLPPALVHTAQLDPIRDDGRHYASRLALAGSPVVYREAEGMIHGFMRARFGGKDANREFLFICDFLKKYLHADNSKIAHMEG